MNQALQALAPLQPSLTTRPTWKIRQTHYQKVHTLHLRRLFANGLGKALSERTFPELKVPQEPQLHHDSSTNVFIRRYRRLKR